MFLWQWQFEITIIKSSCFDRARSSTTRRAIRFWQFGDIYELRFYEIFTHQNPVQILTDPFDIQFTIFSLLCSDKRIYPAIKWTSVCMCCADWQRENSNISSPPGYRNAVDARSSKKVLKIIFNCTTKPVNQLFELKKKRNWNGLDTLTRPDVTPPRVTRAPVKCETINDDTVSARVIWCCDVTEKQLNYSWSSWWVMRWHMLLDTRQTLRPLSIMKIAEFARFLPKKVVDQHNSYWRSTRGDCMQLPKSEKKEKLLQPHSFSLRWKINRVDNEISFKDFPLSNAS